MLAQYVHPSKRGLFRIVQHGRRWRVLIDDHEAGRYEDGAAALAAARAAWPRARLPDQLQDWRYLPERALAHSRLSVMPPSALDWQVSRPPEPIPTKSVPAVEFNVVR